MVLWYKKGEGVSATGSFSDRNHNVAIYLADSAKGQCAITYTHRVYSKLLLVSHALCAVTV